MKPCCENNVAFSVCELGTDAVTFHMKKHPEVTNYTQSIRTHTECSLLEHSTLNALQWSLDTQPCADTVILEDTISMR